MTLPRWLEWLWAYVVHYGKQGRLVWWEGDPATLMKLEHTIHQNDPGFYQVTVYCVTPNICCVEIEYAI